MCGAEMDPSTNIRICVTLVDGWRQNKCTHMLRNACLPFLLGVACCTPTLLLLLRCLGPKPMLISMPMPMPMPNANAKTNAMSIALWACTTNQMCLVVWLSGCLVVWLPLLSSLLIDLYHIYFTSNGHLCTLAKQNSPLRAT